MSLIQQTDLHHDEQDVRSANWYFVYEICDVASLEQQNHLIEVPAIVVARRTHIETKENLTLGEFLKNQSAFEETQPSHKQSDTQLHFNHTIAMEFSSEQPRSTASFKKVSRSHYKPAFHLFLRIPPKVGHPSERQMYVTMWQHFNRPHNGNDVHTIVRKSLTCTQNGSKVMYKWRI